MTNCLDRAERKQRIRASYNYDITDPAEIAERCRKITDLFTTIERVDDGAFIVTIDHNRFWGYERVAQYCSLYSQRGQWSASPNGVVWRLGSRSVHFVDLGVYEDIRAARDLALWYGDNPPWSIGGCARILLRHVGGKRIYDDGAAEIVGDTGEMPYGYRQCTPTTTEHAEYFDVSGCWYNILKSLPGPDLIYCKSAHRIIVPRQEPAKLERWNTIIEVVQSHKLLRNALVGSCMAGCSWRHLWCKGDQIRIKIRPGAFRTVGLLTARIASELCWIAAQQTNAIYAYTDGIITTGGKAPTAWGDYGLRTRIIASGSTDVCAPAILKCGEKQTKYYQYGVRLREHVEPGAEPVHWFWKDAIKWVN